ncbi:MAG TPA: DUF2911 domain-containing protein [Candidatus Acidoferrales bacterium]
MGFGDQSGTEYDRWQDFGRVNMKVTTVNQPLEPLTISRDKPGERQGMLKIAWETTVASVPFELLK